MPRKNIRSKSVAFRDCGNGHWIESAECAVCKLDKQAKQMNFKRWPELKKKLQGKELYFKP